MEREDPVRTKPPPGISRISPMNPVLQLTLSIPLANANPGSSQLPSPHSPISPLPSSPSWKAVKPGYGIPSEDPETQQASVQIERRVQFHSNRELDFKDYIPFMSKPVAFVCFLFNVVCPGLGTLLSAMSIVCGAQPRPRGIPLLDCMQKNIWVAFLQLVSTAMLIGWFWSVAWGWAFLTMKDDKEEEESNAEPSTQSSHHTHHTQATSLTTVSLNYPQQSEPQIIVLQEQPVITHSDLSLPPLESPLMRPLTNRQRRNMRRSSFRGASTSMLSAEMLGNIVMSNAPLPGNMQQDENYFTPK
ncbi:hypothetical protein CAPTEDRAFT_224035 [Capitella teleta]|uniref:Protein SPEC3 n=1 Tax=Capitella teleta TaxID=283909 RepID=R7U3C9_CAPTE|nr:hypothetical protein CAPTEDRAFT_200510 [Capitella teleta]ELU12550.1 hypothetical protein CAPTEDRAFT_224035 [Capitella teleta]|eukprot:ELU00459.1 hypothetical protein CAPTEDRAFT_200510 [Capitella teleta]